MVMAVGCIYYQKKSLTYIPFVLKEQPNTKVFIQAIILRFLVITLFIYLSWIHFLLRLMFLSAETIKLCYFRVETGKNFSKTVQSSLPTHFNANGTLNHLGP